MELTQKDFDERVARNAAGDATDEDRRLIAHYQANGFTPGAKDNNPDRPLAADDEDATVTSISEKPARGRAGAKS